MWWVVVGVGTRWSGFIYSWWRRTVLETEAMALLQLEILPEEFLVVSHLDDEHALEHILQVLGEHEGNQMPQVQRLR